jgi:thiol-disulfide isomerase/thioredoxin
MRQKLLGCVVFAAVLLVLMVGAAQAQAACDPQATCNGHGTCNASGQCVCNTGYAGANCSQCATNHFGYPTCKFCLASTTCNGHGTCNASGNCSCNAEFTGTGCSQCATNHFGYPTCKFCLASTTCNGHGACDASGNCSCNTAYTGATCSGCATNHFGYPTCKFCLASTTCNGHGTCNASGNCLCNTGFAGTGCSGCATNYFGYPTCAFCLASTTCNGQGVCDTSGGCVCNAGFCGPSCNGDLPPLVVGGPFPDVTAPDETNTLFQLSAQRGQVVLLNFSAAWCAPCRTGASFEAELAQTLDAQIGASNWLLVDALFQDAGRASTDVADATSWRTTSGTPAVTLHGEAGATLQDLVAGLGIVNIPTYVVVDPDGKVGTVLEGFTQSNVLSDAVASVWTAYVARPPVITAKGDVVVEASVAPVRVAYTTPIAADAIDGPVSVSCLPKSGSLFPFGKSTVNCSATDASGHIGRLSFAVTVQKPTTSGAVTNPGNDKPLTKVGPGRRVRISAGGFEPGSTVTLLWLGPAGETFALGTTVAGEGGRIDTRPKVPANAPPGTSHATALGANSSGGESLRAWQLEVLGN